MEQNERETRPYRDYPEEEEIDLVEIIQKLWKNRKLIIKVTACFMVLGVLVALFSPKVYTAGSTMVPQTGDKKSSGGLSGLASMMGINLGSMGGGEVLSPKVYPKILKSVPFRKELMNTPLTLQDYEEPVTLLDYMTKEEYRKFSLGGFIKKYTIGLPGLIIGAIRGKDTTTITGGAGSALESLTKEELKVFRALEEMVTLTLNDKEGYIQLSASFSEPLAVAQLAQRAQTLLQDYITEFKVEKVASNLAFVQERYNEAKKNFEAKQQELARFRDANKSFASALARTQEEKLSAEYNLLYSVYSELAKQLEQANIAVKETTPILTVVEPIVIPNERSKPRRAMICVLFTFLGGCAGAGLVLGVPFVAEAFKNDKLKRFIKE